MAWHADRVASTCAALLLAAVVWLPTADTLFQPLTAKAISPTIILAGVALALRAASRLDLVEGFIGDEIWIRFLARLMDGPVRGRRPRASAITQGAAGYLFIAVGLLALLR